MQLRYLCYLLLGLSCSALGAAGNAFAAPVSARSGAVLIERNLVSPALNRGASIAKHDGPSIELIALPVSDSASSFTANATSHSPLVTTDLDPLLNYCGALVAAGIAAHCSPDYVLQASLTPNDTNFSALYGMTKIAAPSAWNTSTGSAQVVVAVIDTGTQFTHPDLSANIWTNPGETAGDGIDNDGNGYIDDVHGYDFVDSDGAPLDLNGHGTHVAGTIGAVGENARGVVGVNHTVSLQLLRVLDAQGSGFTSDIILAVNYAANNGAHVINMSLGGPGYSSVFESAIRAAGDKGVLVVAAAGNEAANNDSTPSYPANYNLPNMISVAATDDNDALADFSNFGATTVQIAAPGVNILSTYPPNSYTYLSGTSMASPHVAGAAALMKAGNPALTALSLRALILENGDPVTALNGAVSTGMRLNAANAVAASIGATPIPEPEIIVDGVTVSATRVGSRAYRINTLVFAGPSSASQGVADIEVTLTCNEKNGRKRTYRRTGVSSFSGRYAPRITFTAGASRASCRAVTTDPRKSSRTLALAVKR